MIPVPDYLARIGYAGPTSPTLENLRALHHAHMLAVPFENLDIALGRKIVVDQDVTVRKVVQLRRGGFCYELNGAFAALLRALGYSVTLLSARVSRQTGGEGPEFDHLALRLDLRDDGSEAWLADVGFGDSFLEPLRLDPNYFAGGREHVDRAGHFRIVNLDERLHMQKIVDGNWKDQYSFTLQPRVLNDFAEMCHYHQTSPKSSFTQSSLCSRATPEGRITLSNMRLITTSSGERTERVIGSDQERREILRLQFGITL